MMVYLFMQMRIISSLSRKLLANLLFAGITLLNGNHCTTTNQHERERELRKGGGSNVYKRNDGEATRLDDERRQKRQEVEDTHRKLPVESDCSITGGSWCMPLSSHNARD